MLDLTNIMKEWEQDSEIGINLEEASRNTPKLHAKYLNYYSVAKLQLKRAENAQKILLKEKYLWFNGKMSKDDIDQRGWQYDPFDGLKIMKGDLSRYYDSDPDIQKSEEKLEYMKTTVEVIREMVDHIKWRHQTLKNIIEMRKFEAGG